MENKKKLIIGGAALVVLGVIAYFLLKKKTPTGTAATTTPVKPLSPQAIADAKAKPETAYDNEGKILVCDSWDDAGGCYNKYKDGTQAYYRVDGSFVQSNDAAGNVLKKAEYNNWDDMGGYRHVYTNDGSADYFRKDGTFVNNISAAGTITY